IVPQVSVGFGVDFPKKNNIYTGYMLYWIKYVTNNKYMDREAFINNRAKVYEKLYKEGIAFNKLDSLDGKKNPVFQKWLKHPSYDEFWTKRVPYKEEYKKINIPILTTTGYFDADQLGAMYYFKEHMKYNPEASHYLLIGPYDHGAAQNFARRTINSQVIDSVANMNINDVAFEWFDYVLKGKEKPAFLKDKINYQVMGANEWRSAPSIEEMSNSKLRFYLSNVENEEFYTLSSNKNPVEGYLGQEVDFKDRNVWNNNYYPDPIITEQIGGTGYCFISEPFEKSILVNGSFTGALQVSINKKDFDFGVTLYEVTPDEKYFHLSYIVGRASYSTDITTRRLLTSNSLETIPFSNTHLVSKKLEKGSRLLVYVDVNKNPFSELNYGTGKEVTKENIKDGNKPLIVKWYNSSYVEIPIRKE
ncbi:MAG: CocE/NonD family hydrolase, partial [Chitinophagales bacterium]|nr:CocE/NonD family hydrolase [Chitinophagales bacterium]